MLDYRNLGIEKEIINGNPSLASRKDEVLEIIRQVLEENTLPSGIPAIPKSRLLELVRKEVDAKLKN